MAAAITFLLALLLTVPAIAQTQNEPERRLEGIVVDDKGEPLTGAIVKDKTHNETTESSVSAPRATASPWTSPISA